MAEDTEKDDSQEAPKKSKKLLFIIIGAVLLLLIGAGAGYFLMMGSQETEAEVVEEVKLPAVYTKIRTKNGRPMFVSTLLSDDDKVHYLQAFIEVKSRDPSVAPALEKHMPLIVSRLNAMFSTQQYAELSSLEGKENLRMDATKLIQNIMQQRIKMPGVEEVLFTNFVMQ